MKLYVPLMLVALGLCFYEANAVPCPVLLKEMTDFLMLNKYLFKFTLAKFNAPEEAAAAKLLVKDCVDKMDFLSRAALLKSLTKIINNCV